MRRKQIVQTCALLVLIAALAGVVLNRQAISDWFKLRGYIPPATVAALATDDTMTSEARHLFYVNHPDVTTGVGFTAHCPSGGEKTVVLGCYIGNDHGIYLYNITDSRLNGVEQVTAAHETLHAAYERMSAAERTTINAELLDYYNHDLTDQRIKDTIAEYKKSEPKDVVNEMHSIFGTEVANLPAPLETYYRRYFTDRSKLTTYVATYQAEFTSRSAAIARYDAQLKGLKQQIDTNQAALAQQKTALDAQSQRLSAQRKSNDIAGYNAGVSSYNAAVNSYNNLLETTKGLIAQYNDTVSSRNAIAIEEQELTRALSADSLTTAQ